MTCIIPYLHCFGDQNSVFNNPKDHFVLETYILLSYKNIQDLMLQQSILILARVLFSLNKILQCFFFLRKQNSTRVQFYNTCYVLICYCITLKIL